MGVRLERIDCISTALFLLMRLMDYMVVIFLRTLHTVSHNACTVIKIEVHCLCPKSGLANQSKPRQDHLEELTAKCFLMIISTKGK